MDLGDDEGEAKLVPGLRKEVEEVLKDKILGKLNLNLPNVEVASNLSDRDRSPTSPNKLNNMSQEKTACKTEVKAEVELVSTPKKEQEKKAPKKIITEFVSFNSGKSHQETLDKIFKMKSFPLKEKEAMKKV